MKLTLGNSSNYSVQRENSIQGVMAADLKHIEFLLERREEELSKSNGIFTNGGPAD